MHYRDIHIRDPFVLAENGKYYMYGTRARDFGIKTAGFDVYISTDLQNWSDPIPCFDSLPYGLNSGANWAPEVHAYQGSYYMFATFVNGATGLRGTYILKADSPLGPFLPHSQGPVTPVEWECLDGTFYLNRQGQPYLVFCHEHTQIIDGTVCYLQLSDDLRQAASAPTTVFHGSSMLEGQPEENVHYVTDGPFLYRTKSDVLLMIWSTFVRGQYAQCLARFDGGELGTQYTHLPPLVDDDGGHGMIFRSGSALYLTLHTPNTLGLERPTFIEIEDRGDTIAIISK